MCRQLATWGAEFDEAVRAVVQSGASPDEIREAQGIMASLMASLYVDVARPVLKRYPDLEPIFTGAPDRAPA